MKTTVEISDALFEEAKSIARDQRVTLREMIETGLRQEVEARKAQRPFKLRDASFKGDGLQRGMSQDDWEQIRDAAYKGRGA